MRKIEHRIMKNETVTEVYPQPTFPRLGIITPVTAIPRNRSRSRQQCLSTSRKSTRNAGYAGSYLIDWTAERQGNEHLAEIKDLSPLVKNFRPSMGWFFRGRDSSLRGRGCSWLRLARFWSLGQSWNLVQISQNCSCGDGDRWLRNWHAQHTWLVPSYEATHPFRGLNCAQDMHSQDISEILNKTLYLKAHIYYTMESSFEQHH